MNLLDQTTLHSTPPTESELPLLHLQETVHVPPPYSAPCGPPREMGIGGRPFRQVCVLGKGGHGSVWLYASADDPRSYATVKTSRLTDAVDNLGHQLRVLAYVEDRCDGVRGQIRGVPIGDLSPSAVRWGDDYAAPMPYVDGVPLGGVLEKGKNLPHGVALHVAAQIADRLRMFHDAGLAHRDVKPENVILTVPRREEPKPAHALEFIDLELARAPGLTPPKATGTPLYMPVEQWKEMFDAREDPAGIHADTYAFALMLYRMLRGKDMIHRDSTFLEAYCQHQACEKGAALPLLRTLPQRIRSLLSACLRPARLRPPMAEVQDTLARACRMHGIDPGAPLLADAVDVPLPKFIPPARVARRLRAA